MKFALFLPALLVFASGVPSQADGLTAIKPYYECFMGMAYYQTSAPDARPVELIGPRKAQFKDFSWQKNRIVVRYSRRTGASGFFVISPANYHFIPMPRILPAGGAFMELRSVDSSGENREPLRVHFTDEWIRSEETDKLFPIFKFPPQTVFRPINLYHAKDPDFFPAFAQELVQRIGIAIEDFEKRKSAGSGSAYHAASDYRQEFDRCSRVPDKRVRMAALTALTSLMRLESAPASGLAPNPVRPKSGRAAGIEAAWMQAREFFRKVRDNPTDHLGGLGGFAGLLVLMFGLWPVVRKRTVYRSFIRNNFMTMTESGVYRGIIQKQVIEVSCLKHEGYRYFQLSVKIPGEVPLDFKAHLKRPIRGASPASGAAGPIEGAVFDKYIEARCAILSQLLPYLSPWRKGAILRLLVARGTLIESSWLIYRRRGLPADGEEIWDALALLLNTAVHLQME